MSILHSYYSGLLERSGFVFKYTYPHTFVNESSNLSFHVYVQCIEVRITDIDKLIFEGDKNTPYHILEELFSIYGRRCKLKKIIKRIHEKSI